VYAHRPIVVVCWVLLALSASGIVSSSPRVDAVARFQELAKAGEPGLVVSVDGAQGGQVSVGDEIAFEFVSDKRAYLTAFYIDSHGVTTILYPTANPEDALLQAGQVKRFPPDNKFTVSPPLGLEHILAMTTPVPLSREYFVEGYVAEPPVLGPLHAPALIRNMIAVAERLPAGAVSATTFAQTVQGTNRHGMDAIVTHFGKPSTRSLHRRKLDLEIRFNFDGDELSEEAMEQLDAVADALSDPKLMNRSFSLDGYTDQVGSSDYNMKLSERRAKAAMNYLVEDHGIDPERLASKGFGEADPLMPEDSEIARSMNRRVTLTGSGGTTRAISGPTVPDPDILDFSEITIPLK
jgi:outer membrane protein OmpA-like peptidoglycan-associated protein